MSFPNSEDTHHQHQQQATGVDNCDEVGWYILGENQQNLGPYAFSELREHFLNGYLSENSLLWSEGRSDWQPLSSIPELTTAISQPGVDCSSAGPPINDEDEFEKWQKEVREAEALKNGSASGSVGGDFGDEDNERPSTPPDGEDEFTDDDGTTYKWDRGLRAWVPQVTSWTCALVYYYSSRTFSMTVFLSWSKILSFFLRKKDFIRQSPDKKGAQPTYEANKPPDSWFDLKVNTHVYVTGLPDDVTVDEVVEVFSKCGLIKEDSQGKQYRIQIYGCAYVYCCIFIFLLKKYFIVLSCHVIPYISSMPVGTIPMSVTLAKFEQKGEKFVAKQIDKRKKKKLKRVEDKILGWGGHDDAKLSIPATVVLRYMFTPAEMRADPNLRSELEGDVQEECIKLGSVDLVKVCESHPQGVVLVKYKDRRDAQKCIELMNGRWFGGRQIHASEDDGSVNHALVRDLDADAERLEAFGAELEDES
uniref:RRM domain-containing protein n=1 Tax=Vitis vinifera TaxID=29760 RepID=F6GZC6_VITVI